MVSISVRPTRYSYDIIQKTGEFVINLTNDSLVKACDYCGVVSGRDVDKYEKMGLTPLPMEHVKAPGIAESPVCMECRVVECKPLGSHTMFLAEVLGVTIDDAYMDENGKFCINDSGLVMYSHGEYFCSWEKAGEVWLQCSKETAVEIELFQQQIHQIGIYILILRFPVFTDCFGLFLSGHRQCQVDE